MVGLDEPPLSEAESFKTKKSHQILQPWSCLVATCTLALLYTTLERHIALMLNKSSRSIASHDHAAAHVMHGGNGERVWIG